jgi:hypothetical protein
MAFIGAMLHHFAAPLLVVTQLEELNGKFQMRCQFMLAIEEIEKESFDNLPVREGCQILIIVNCADMTDWLIFYSDNESSRKHFNCVSKFFKTAIWKLPMHMVVTEGKAVLLCD